MDKAETKYFTLAEAKLELRSTASKRASRRLDGDLGVRNGAVYLVGKVPLECAPDGKQKLTIVDAYRFVGSEADRRMCRRPFRFRPITIESPLLSDHKYII